MLTFTPSLSTNSMYTTVVLDSSHTITTVVAVVIMNEKFRKRRSMLLYQCFMRYN